MTDRSVRADQLAHDRRTNPQTDDDLRSRIAEALMRWAERNNSPRYAPIRRPETVTRNAYDRADAVLAAVQPELDRLTAERDQAHRDCQSYADLASGAERTRQFHKDDADRYEEQLRQERDRYRAAWQSARFRAEAHSEGSQRHIEARDDWKGWMHEQAHRAEQAEAAIARVRRYCELTADSCRVQAREMAIDVLQIIDGKNPHEVLIDRTSVGSPDVRLIAARTPPEDVERILRRARGLDDDDRPNPPYDLPDGFRSGAGGEQ
jgi:hypothetical protein